VTAAFFCVANSRHFVGAAALLNSLRAVGHDEPFYLTDCGLTDRQREILDGHATLIPVPGDVSPLLLKMRGPLEVDPEVAIILDADVLAVRPLTGLIGPRPVVFANDLTYRFEPEWARLGFGEPKRIPYLNSGHMIIPRASGLLPRLQQGNERLLEIIRAEPGTCQVPTDLFYYTDQDVLNALIGTLDDDEYVISEDVAYWPFKSPGSGVRLLHHIQDKPWLRALRPNAYSREMVRMLAGGPVEVPLDEIPVRLRCGPLAAVARARASVQHTVRDYTRGRLGIRRRLAERAGVYQPATR
jgi:hypothetical protein